MQIVFTHFWSFHCRHHSHFSQNGRYTPASHPDNPRCLSCRTNPSDSCSGWISKRDFSTLWAPRPACATEGCFCILRSIFRSCRSHARSSFCSAISSSGTFVPVWQGRRWLRAVWGMIPCWLWTRLSCFWIFRSGLIGSVLRIAWNDVVRFANCVLRGSVSTLVDPLTYWTCPRCSEIWKLQKGACVGSGVGVMTTGCPRWRACLIIADVCRFLWWKTGGDSLVFICFVYKYVYY